MELLADRDPEQTRKLLDPVLEHMMDAVHHYEGTVNQVMGDGIMALFGAPLAHEDHAVRACYAALRMQESVRHYADEVRRTEGIPIQIRVGLNSGEVVVRSIGSDLRMDYTAVGPDHPSRGAHGADGGARHRAHHGKHPESRRGLGGIALARAHARQGARGAARGVRDRRRGRGAVTASGLGAARPLALRGRGRPSSISSARRSSAPRPAGARWWRWWASPGWASRGSSTRSSRAMPQPRHGACSRAAPSPTASPPRTCPSPISSRATSRSRAATRPGRFATRSRGGSSPSTPRARRRWRRLLALLDVPVDEPRWQSLDPSQRRQRTLDAVKALLLRESQVQPAAPRLRGSPVDGQRDAGPPRQPRGEPAPRPHRASLVNYRPEYTHGWGSKTYYARIRLNTLHADGSAELLDALLGDDPGLDPLKQLLARAHGRQSLLPRGERAHPGGDGRPRRRARGLSGSGRRSIRSRCRRRCRPSWPPASTGCP